MNLIKKKENFILLLVVIIFLIINNFFYNFYYTLKTNYSSRMNYHYGYCDNNGYGFIKYIIEKYKLTKNIKIFNYKQKPSSEWFFFDPNKEYYSEKLILLNNNNLNVNNKITSKIYLRGKYQGSYKVIERYENCFFIERVND
jgi:hypothetical protein